LSEGFKGRIWFDETLYMIFEGAMMSLCVIIMTTCHVGIGFCGRYGEADFKYRIPKAKPDSSLPESELQK